MSLPILSSALLLACALTGQAQTVTKALDSIHAAELMGDLSFLASDLLAGRYTPSPGLEVAAEYIASKFRAAGLEPAGGSGYFQLARMVDRQLPKVVTPLMGKDGQTSITVEPGKIRVTKASLAASIVNVRVVKILERDAEKLKSLNVEGKVVLTDGVSIGDKNGIAFDREIASSKALMELVVDRTVHSTQPPRLLFAEEASGDSPPIVHIESPELAAALETSSELSVSLEIPAPSDQNTTVKNVIGLLRGSDAALKSTCVLVTSHYDHIGTADTASYLSVSAPTAGDKIYNGANDDGSGTVSVIEIARALSQLHPKRSILFITFFGEERGLLGSTYYGRHPVFPIGKTIAEMNLELLGRIDPIKGPASVSITGEEYSDVAAYFAAAAGERGISINRDEQASEEYFVRSDNLALAEQGVPAHTLTTTFEYPDYHGVGDEWQKIDYNNMEKVDRMVALAVFNLANAAKAPEWNKDNPKTEAFRNARRVK